MSFENRPNIRKIKNYLKEHDEKCIFILTFLIEIIFGLILINKYGSTYFYLDSTSHIYDARNVIDNGINSGLATLVGTWLPAFELLQIPFVKIGILYTTGFSGTIINAIMTGGIAVYLYKLFGGRNNRLSILMPIVFLSNIYGLIFGVTPMTEQMATLALVATAYFFKNYLETGETKEFMKASLVLIFGSLVKYEIWIVALFVLSIFFVKEIIVNRKIYKIGYAHMPLWGMIAWLFTNLMIHKDPLWWNDNPASNNVLMETTLPLYFKGSIFLTMKHALIQMNMTYGILLYLTVISIIFIIASKKMKWVITLIIFFIPTAVNIYLMYEGKSAGHQRYFYTPLPGIILLNGILLDNIITFLNTNKDFLIKMYEKSFATLRSVGNLLFISIIIMAAVQSQQAANNIKEIKSDPLQSRPWIYQGLDMPNDRVFYKIDNEKKTFVSDLNFVFLSSKNKDFDKVKNIIGQEKILMPSFLVTDTEEGIRASMFSVSEGISPKQIIDGFDYLEYEKVMKEPWNYAKFVMVSNISQEGAENANKIYGGNFYLYNYNYNQTWRSEFMKRYHLVFEDKDKLYQLN